MYRLVHKKCPVLLSTSQAQLGRTIAQLSDLSFARLCTIVEHWHDLVLFTSKRSGILSFAFAVNGQVSSISFPNHLKFSGYINLTDKMNLTYDYDLQPPLSAKLQWRYTWIFPCPHHVPSKSSPLWKQESFPSPKSGGWSLSSRPTENRPMILILIWREHGLFDSNTELRKSLCKSC